MSLYRWKECYMTNGYNYLKYSLLYILNPSLKLRVKVMVAIIYDSREIVIVIYRVARVPATFSRLRKGATVIAVVVLGLNILETASE